MRISWYLWMFSKVFKISTVLWTLFKKNHEFQKDNRENISIFLSLSFFTPNLSQENKHLSSQKHVLVIVERCNEAITSATPSPRNFTTWHPPPLPQKTTILSGKQGVERERDKHDIKEIKMPFQRETFLPHFLQVGWGWGRKDPHLQPDVAVGRLDLPAGVSYCLTGKILSLWF